MASLSQNFDWADNTLFFHEIPNATDPEKTAVFLGGKDIIIDSSVSKGAGRLTAAGPTLSRAT